MIFFAISIRCFLFVVIRSALDVRRICSQGSPGHSERRSVGQAGSTLIQLTATALILPERRRSHFQVRKFFGPRRVRQGPPTYKFRRIENDRWGFARLSTIAHVGVVLEYLLQNQTARTSKYLLMVPGASVLRKGRPRGVHHPPVFPFMPTLRVFTLFLAAGLPGIPVDMSSTGFSFWAFTSHARPSVRSTEIPYQFRSNSYQASP